MHVVVTGVNFGAVLVSVAADTLRGDPDSHPRECFHASYTGRNLQSCHSSMKLAHLCTDGQLVKEVHERSAHDVPCHADVLLLSLQACPLLDAAVEWPEVDLLSLQASPLLDAAVDWPEVDVVGRLCHLDFPVLSSVA